MNPQDSQIHCCCVAASKASKDSVATVEVNRPPPGEELNTGEVTPARPAASAILLRDGDDGLEVLLVQRNPEQKFMGGAWVFPGGAVHSDDDGGDPAAAAL